MDRAPGEQAYVEGASHPSDAPRHRRGGARRGDSGRGSGAAEAAEAEAPPPTTRPTSRAAEAAPVDPTPRPPTKRLPTGAAEEAPADSGRADLSSRQLSRRQRPSSEVPAREEDGEGSLVELVIIVVVALGLALGIQAFLVKPFRIPSESMEPTLDVGQRVLVDRVRRTSAIPTAATSSCSSRRRAPTTNAAASERRPNQPCPIPTQGAVGHELHQARRRHPRRPAQAVKEGAVYIERQAAERALHSSGRCVRNVCNQPREITIPPGSLFHDGRQPWRLRRQPCLGPRSPRSGSSAEPSSPTGRPSASARL